MSSSFSFWEPVNTPTPRVPRRVDELLLDHVDRFKGKGLGRLAITDVLVLDDWSLVPLREPQRWDVQEVFEDRRGPRAPSLGRENGRAHPVQPPYPVS
ncbi:MAG: hypothetical protein RL885_30595 [Planctomycetota bacterium]